MDTDKEFFYGSIERGLRELGKYPQIEKLKGICKISAIRVL